VLVIAFFALRNPKHPSTAAGSRTVTHTVPAPATTRASSSSHAASTSSPAKPSTTRSSAVGSKPLIVLSVAGVPNLARDAARRFEGGGWSVTTYDDDYNNSISSTVAYYDPDVPGAKAAALALKKQYPAIKRVAPRFAPEAGGDPLPAGPVVVVLTSDYSPG
jgi:hypothetical protein